MKFQIEDLDVYWPFDRVYPEQYQYMTRLKQTLDAKGNCLLEMPTGTGKTVSLLALITSYQLRWPKKVGKLIYCTRTVPEMTKAMIELKRVVRGRAEQLKRDEDKVYGDRATNVTAVCLSSRRNLCVNEDVVAPSARESIDSACRKLTAPFIRSDPSQQKCDFFEKFDREGSDFTLGPSTAAKGEAPIYTLEDLQEFGREKKWCPYFLARHAITYANVVIFNYQYMLDPKVSQMVSKELDNKSIVVFDEAHNIDSVCIEALSINLTNVRLQKAQKNLESLAERVEDVEKKDKQKLEKEYRDLVANLQQSGHLPNSTSSTSSSGFIPPQLLAQNSNLQAPILPDSIITEAIPGNIRRAKHFLKFMYRLVTHIKRRLQRNSSVIREPPIRFLDIFCRDTGETSKTLKFTYSRLNSLMRTLEILDMEKYMPLQLVADFATLIATYEDGFVCVIEPSSIIGNSESVMQLACLDASLAIKHVFERFQSVVITSGTLSPIDLYPKLLGFTPNVRESLSMSVTRKPILPMVVSRGTDQTEISSAYQKRDNLDVVKNFGDLLVSLSSVVPDGIICFFTSYDYMERTINAWDLKGVIKALQKRKLVFIETKDIVETTIALDNYRKACDCGRGAIFFSIARGKVAEGIDFNNHYGRCVVMMGVPYQYTQSHVLQARLDYLRSRHEIHENDFLTFDAIRQTSQCIGRVIRSKTDYGLIVLADERYAKPSKRNKLPPWVRNFLQDENLNISTNVACALARNFLISSAQPLTEDEINFNLLDKDKLEDLHNQWVDENPNSAAARQAFHLRQRQLDQILDDASSKFDWDSDAPISRDLTSLKDLWNMQNGMETSTDTNPRSRKRARF